MREAIRDIDRLRHIDECIEHINDYLIIATNATLVLGYLYYRSAIVEKTNYSIH